MDATIIDASGQTTLTSDAARARAAAGDKAPFVWIDLRGERPGDPQTQQFLADLGFTRILQAYTGRVRSSGQFVTFGGVLLGTTWVADATTGGLAEVHFAWNPQQFVTVRSAGDAAVASAREEAVERGAHLFGHPTHVPGVVLQWLLDSVVRALTELEGRIDAVDSQIIESVHPAQLDEVRALRAQTTPYVRRFPSYSEAVHEGLVEPAITGMDSNGVQSLQMYANSVQAVVDQIGDAFDGLRNAIQDYQNEIGNKQGARINQLTIVSMVFLPISFLTGYFGMNFNWLDDQLESLWIWVALGVVLPILMVVGSIVVLSRRGYFPRIGRRRADRHGAHTDPSASD